MKSPTTPQTTTGDWCISCGDTLLTVSSTSDALPKILDLIRNNENGRIELIEDIGSRGWFGRFIGFSPRILQGHFAIEWTEDIASLVFFDDADSEFRAKNSDNEEIKGEEKRRKIAHGELEAHPIDQCMILDEAIRAITEYLQTLERPKWIEYHYVK